MHFDHSQFPVEYSSFVRKKLIILCAGIIGLWFVFCYSISCGAVHIPLMDVAGILLGDTENARYTTIIWNIRLPQALTALVAGAGLSLCGAAMQSILRNPLASPFTLGISNAAAFGAAFSVMILGTGTMSSRGISAIHINKPYLTTAVSFIFCMAASSLIWLMARKRKSSPEVIVLTGVALGSLFTAGTMLLQYFADDQQLAAMVFWTFGDTSRASWAELGLMTIVTTGSFLFFFASRWSYNAMEAGDETAKGLGVHTERVRILGMLVSSLVTAVIISFLGIIGFIGLVCPHLARRIIGDNYCHSLPLAAIFGSILLLAADTIGRTILSPHTLPVAIVTAFLGAPVFIYLLIKGKRQ